MERLVTVEFGPSRSKRLGKALAEAQSGPGECSELEPGRYRAKFVLGEDAAVYTGLARLLERVRHWRATDVYEDDEPVSAFHAKDIEVSGCPNSSRCSGLPDSNTSSDSVVILEHSPGQTLSSLAAAGSRHR